MKLVKHTNYRKSPNATASYVTTWVGFRKFDGYFVVRLGWHEWEFSTG